MSDSDGNIMLGLMNRCSAASANNLLLYWEVFFTQGILGSGEKKYKKHGIIPECSLHVWKSRFLLAASEFLGILSDARYGCKTSSDLS